MRKGPLVIAVDADPHVTTTIRDGLGQEGIRVEHASTAREGMDLCAEMQPDCLVVDLDLPDQDGISLVEVVRSQPEMTVATTPIVLLSSRSDEATRVRALCAGVDVIAGKPFHGVELVAQIRAVLKMALRLRNRRSSMGAGPPSVTPQTALAGDLRRMSIATVLGALELERRSGELCLSGSGGVKLHLSIASGFIAGGRMDSRSMNAVDSLREALRWPGRRFEFVPGQERPPPPGAQPLGTLVMAIFKHEPAPPSASPPVQRANVDWGDSPPAGVPYQTRTTGSGRSSGTHRKVAPPTPGGRGHDEPARSKRPSRQLKSRRSG